MVRKASWNILRIRKEFSISKGRSFTNLLKDRNRDTNSNKI